MAASGSKAGKQHHQERGQGGGVRTGRRESVSIPSRQHEYRTIATQNRLTEQNDIQGAYR